MTSSSEVTVLSNKSNELNSESDDLANPTDQFEPKSPEITTTMSEPVKLKDTDLETLNAKHKNIASTFFELRDHAKLSTDNYENWRAAMLPVQSTAMPITRPAENGEDGGRE